MSIELGFWALAFVGAACLVSGFAHGALGFGFPMVATPLVALVLDVKSAIVLLAPLTLLLVLISVARGGAVAPLAREFWFLPLALATGAWLGARLLLAAPPEPFILVLALVILLYLNLERLGRGQSPLVRARRAAFGAGFGFAAGVFESIANVAGPVLLVYFMLIGLAPAQLVQALNLCFAVGKTTQVATLAAGGALGAPVWLAVALLSVPSVAALFAGMRLRSRIDAATYRRWLRGALWVMVALLLGQFATAVAAADDPLLQAIEERKEVYAEGLVVRGRADVNARNAQRETPLHLAVEKDMRVLARALLKAGADLRARSATGETVLHYAALHADPFFVDLLLAAGADPKARNDGGESVLMWAALSGHLVVAQRLLNDGADPNVRDLQGNTPLHAAADGGHLELARLLLPRMAERGARNREGLSALDYARRRGHAELERLLE